MPSASSGRGQTNGSEWKGHFEASNLSPWLSPPSIHEFWVETKFDYAFTSCYLCHSPLTNSCLGGHNSSDWEVSVLQNCNLTQKFDPFLNFSKNTGHVKPEILCHETQRLHMFSISVVALKELYSWVYVPCDNLSCYRNSTLPHSIGFIGKHKST